MPGQLKGSLFYLYSEVRRLLIIFWAILFGLLVFSIILNTVIYREGVVVFEMSFPLYAVSAVLGQMVVKNSIPYLIKMGSTRSNVFKSIGVHFVWVALFNALVASTVYSIITFIFGKGEGIFTISGFNEEVISFSHIAQFFNNTWASRFMIDFSIMLFLFTCAFLLGLVFYRFGMVGGFTFIGLLIFIFIVGMTRGWLLDFFINVFSNMTLTFFVKLILASIAVYLLSFILLRRLPIES